MSTLPLQHLLPWYAAHSHVRGDVYIETGVSDGTSFRIAMDYIDPPFKCLHGVEVNPVKVARTRIALSSDPRVTIHEGSSLDVLPKIMDLSARTVFWLDAHYDGTDPASYDHRHGQCVLEEELHLIRALSWQHLPIILIDDASTFCSNLWWARGAHGQGMDPRQNPSFATIYDLLGGPEERYDIHIVRQIIVCFPRV